VVVVGGGVIGLKINKLCYTIFKCMFCFKIQKSSPAKFYPTDSTEIVMKFKWQSRKKKYQRRFWWYFPGIRDIHCQNCAIAQGNIFCNLTDPNQ
jgi:hypothetical protein